LIENRSYDRVVVVVVVVVVIHAENDGPPTHAYAGVFRRHHASTTRASDENARLRIVNLVSETAINPNEGRARSIPLFTRSRRRVPSSSGSVVVVGFAFPRDRHHHHRRRRRRRRTYVTTLARLATPATRRSALSSIAAGARAARMPAGFRVVGRPNAAADAVVVLRVRTEDVVAPSVILVVVAALNILFVERTSYSDVPRRASSASASASRAQSNQSASLFLFSSFRALARVWFPDRTAACRAFFSS